MRTLVLYSRPGCHLCEEMKRLVQQPSGRLALRLEEVDITGNPALEGRYGHDIPVLPIDGREAARHRISARDLERRLPEE